MGVFSFFIVLFILIESVIVELILSVFVIVMLLLIMMLEFGDDNGGVMVVSLFDLIKIFGKGCVYFEKNGIIVLGIGDFVGYNVGDIYGVLVLVGNGENFGS